jgi:hypothetical protein
MYVEVPETQISDDEKSVCKNGLDVKWETACLIGTNARYAAAGRLKSFSDGRQICFTNEPAAAHLL